MTTIAMIVDQARGISSSSSNRAEYTGKGTADPEPAPTQLAQPHKSKRKRWWTGKIMAGEVHVWVNLRCCEQVLI